MRTRMVLALALALLLAAGAAVAARPDDAGSNGNGNGNGNGHGQPEQAQGGTGEAPEASNGNAGGNGQGNGHAADAGSGAEAAPGQATHGPAGSQPPSAPTTQAPEAGGSTAADAPAAGAPEQAPPGQAPGQGNAHGQDNGQARGHGDGNAAPASDAAPAASEAPGAQQLPPAAAAAADNAAPHSAVAERAVATVAPELHALAGGIAILPGPTGNRLVWDTATLPDGAQVQVWRQQGAQWVPVATVVEADMFLDAQGMAGDEYRITWSQQPLDSGMLATIAHSLPELVEASDQGWAAPGRWLTLLLVAAIGAVGLVRATGPRRILELRVQDSHDLVTALAGLPGIEATQLERLVNLGLRTVGQLRRLDPDAVAFWAGIPGDMVRRWQHALQLLQWPTLPAGAAERLAITGHASLHAVAAAAPADLLVRLGETKGIDGPGLPADEAEVAAWVAEARQAIGLGQPTVRIEEASAAPKPTARFTWPTAATP